MPDEQIEEKAPETEGVKLPELAVSVTEISSGAKGDQRPLHPNTVAFKVNYPADYPDAKKTMAQGSTVFISKEAAEVFTNLKIGKVVK